MALGASGGMVPCPAALVLLLSCISIGYTGLGLLLLLSFSLGLAIVLIAIGLFVLFAKRMVPEKHRNSESAFMKWMPVLSAAFVLLVGIYITGVSIGLFPTIRFLG